MALSNNTEDPRITTYRLILPSAEAPFHIGVALCTGFREPISFPTLQSNGLNLCIIQAGLIASIDNIIQTVFKAVSSDAKGKMKTKALSTEILLNLSPYKQIKQALNTFGVSKTPDKVWVVSLSNDPTTDVLKFLDLTNAQLMEHQDPSVVADKELIQEIYSIQPQELAIGSLEEAISNRIAVKDL